MEVKLPACHPQTLGLALNLSVFYHELMKQPKEAVLLAEKTLSEALEKLDDMEEEDFREAKSLIEMLKDNLTLW